MTLLFSWCVICLRECHISYLEVGEFLQAVGTGERRAVGGIALVCFDLASHVMKLVLDDVDKQRVADEIVVVTSHARTRGIGLHTHPRSHKLHTHTHTYTHRHTDLQTHTHGKVQHHTGTQYTGVIGHFAVMTNANCSRQSSMTNRPN